MSSEESKRIALSIIEALNARDLSLWSKHLAEDYIAELPGVSAPLNKTKTMGWSPRAVGDDEAAVSPRLAAAQVLLVLQPFSQWVNLYEIGALSIQ
jgi:hypothetical protein